jgi:molybdenum cofactor biosynthesis enzyme MoaA
MSPWRRMDFTFIEVMPLGDVGEGRLDQYLPLSMVRARIAERSPDRIPAIIVHRLTESRAASTGRPRTVMACE